MPWGETAAAVAATLVRALHWAFVIFMLWAPFSSNRTARVLHLLVTPFLWVHWILNDDTCVLTVVEKKLRGLEDASHSFFHALVSPVYRVEDADVRSLVWFLSVALWAITATRVGWHDVLEVLGLSGWRGPSTT